MNQTDTNKTIKPAQPQERIQIIDVIRGFAIFGILIVNMDFFNDSIFGYVMGYPKPDSMLDQLGRWFISFFAEGKFYSMFAFLFGLGMAIQMQRASVKKISFTFFFIKRMLALLFFGIVHAYFIWAGDILILYSVLGIVTVLIFKNCRPKTLVIWTVIFLFIPVIMNTALWGLIEMGRLTPEGRESIDAALTEQSHYMQENREDADRVYSTGTYWEVTVRRYKDMSFIYSIWVFMMFNVMAMFTLGLAAGKTNVFSNINTKKKQIVSVMYWTLPIAIIGNLIFVSAEQTMSRHIPSGRMALAVAGQTFGAPALALFYMAVLTYLSLNPAWKKRLQPLACVGRLAITNYLLQSIICTSLFYGYGLGLYGNTRVITRLLLTVLIYALQIPFSIWWLKKFRFGPVEWFWRTLTYGARPDSRTP
jgi:uncharacterized protein